MSENGELTSKVCTKCGEEKPLEDYEKAKRGKHGRRADCKRCRNKQTLDRMHGDPARMEANRKKSLEYSRANPEANRKRAREYAEAHKEEVNAKAREHWHKSDKEAYNAKRRARRKELYSNDPEFRERRKKESRHSARKRRDRLKGAEGSYTDKEWQAIKKQQDYRCLRCGLQEPDILLTVDHVIPVSKGGTNTADNLQGLCLDCNRTKCDKTIDYRKGTGELPPVPKQLRLSL